MICVGPTYLTPIIFAAIAVPLVVFCAGTVYGALHHLGRELVRNRAPEDNDKSSAEESEPARD